MSSVSELCYTVHQSIPRRGQRAMLKLEVLGLTVEKAGVLSADPGGTQQTQQTFRGKSLTIPPCVAWVLLPLRAKT